MVLILIDRIIRSIPYLSTLRTRQLGSHTWSDQLVPLIWCATCDSAREQLRRALTTSDRGHGALMSFRTWWIEQGVHTAEGAVPLLNTIARQLGVRGPPIRCYQYLQAPIQEHIAALSGAEYRKLLGHDLVRPQQTNKGPPAEDMMGASRDEPGDNAMPTDIERNPNVETCMSTSGHDGEEIEIDSSSITEQLRYALEQYRRDDGQRSRDETNRRIQECIVWPSYSSRRSTEQVEQVLMANTVGTRASSAMRDWWSRHEVESPSRACAYIQGINQSAHPGQVYGQLSAQIIEDLFQAGGASDLIVQDLTVEQSPQGETNRRFDEELISRIRDRLLNRQYWDDGEAWLINSTWLTLPRIIKPRWNRY